MKTLKSVKILLTSAQSSIQLEMQPGNREKVETQIAVGELEKITKSKDMSILLILCLWKTFINIPILCIIEILTKQLLIIIWKIENILNKLGL